MLPSKKLNDFLEMIPLWIFIAMASPLPFGLKIRLGGIWFQIIIMLSNNLRKRITSNLELTYPHITGRNLSKFISQFANLTGLTFTELFYNKYFQTRSEYFSYRTAELEPLYLAKAKGQPIIIVSAHLGPWEAIRAILKENNLTSGAIYKENKNQFYEPLHLKAIRAGGEPIFPTGLNGTKNMVKFLRSGGIVSVLLDQAAEDGEYFNFLGKPAKTSTSIAKLALKLNALVVPAYAIRQKNKNLIDVFFEAPLKNSNYRQMTKEITDSIEKRVSHHPTQWYWLHKRWKY